MVFVLFLFFSTTEISSYGNFLQFCLSWKRIRIEKAAGSGSGYTMRKTAGSGNTLRKTAGSGNTLRKTAGSGSGYWEKQLDPDPQKIKADPQPWHVCWIILHVAAVFSMVKLRDSVRITLQQETGHNFILNLLSANLGICVALPIFLGPLAPTVGRPPSPPRTGGELWAVSTPVPALASCWRLLNWIQSATSWNTVRWSAWLRPSIPTMSGRHWTRRMLLSLLKNK